MPEPTLDATIVIPTYNRRDDLLKTLEILARQDLPADRWEAVVVDDGSTDGTDTAIPEWIERSGAPVRYLKQTNAGPAAARNRGAREARGAVLVFIDNDILVEPNFVRRHLENLRANPGCWLLGRIVHPDELRRTPFGRYRDSVWEQFHESHPDGTLLETGGMSAANFAAPAANFHRLGGFDQDFTIASSEDWELGMRARQSGIRVLYDPGNKVLHNDWAVSLDRFCERQKLYSISDVLLWHKYGDASPRARLVSENGPVQWGRDSLPVVLKKAVKSVLSTSVMQRLIQAGCRVVERAAPDSGLNRKAYNLAVGIAIFAGVREGLRRYGAVRTPPSDRTPQDQATVGISG
jgi:GT2 family glycosyltransferase